MHFIDETTIHVKAGNGGNGCAAFRREAHVPFGGPSGGDGGDGGSVVLIADPQLGTLLDFKYKRHYKAQRGEDGRNRDQYGKRGEDLRLHVPVGTVVTDSVTGDLLADLSQAGQELVLARGGKGGLGNIHFKTAWNQAPRKTEPATEGEEREVRLELKLLADVGLLGFPSVGKSTFISKVSAARPKIADYPFTTLVPNLGVVPLSDHRTMVIADIPGLIEGAAEGAGLGHQFLRHVERTKVLLHILEAGEMTGPERDPMKDFDTLNRELERYAPELVNKPQIVVLNKIDLTDAREADPELRAALAGRGIELHTMSAATGRGVTEILEELWRAVHPPRAELE
ncbi:MAG TPA: GTPase ObgE [Kofleriaceae bacterium]|nr:GTPase ObgE [Kofleriaceae bacterium]